MAIILASGSPRRKELLEMLGIKDLLVIPAKGEEKAPENAGPGEIVEALSRAKALEVAADCTPEDVIIAADTIVWFGGKVYGKPQTEEEAYSMLTSLSGSMHEVYTGVTILHNGRELCEHEVSGVMFRELSAEEIRAYIRTGEPMDKAGGYGAQGKGALLVKRIEGDFFNVMGLPLCRVGEMLKKQGVNVFEGLS